MTGGQLAGRKQGDVVPHLDKNSRRNKRKEKRKQEELQSSKRKRTRKRTRKRKSSKMKALSKDKDMKHVMDAWHR